jgi:hypothetical protein
MSVTHIESENPAVDMSLVGGLEPGVPRVEGQEDAGQEARQGWRGRPGLREGYPVETEQAQRPGARPGVWHQDL